MDTFNFVRPNRLAWRDDPEKQKQNLTTKEDQIETIRKDFSKALSDFQKNDIKAYEAFFQKHGDFIKSNREAYEVCLGYSWYVVGIDAYKKLVDFGKAYLKSNKVDKREYAYNVLEHLNTAVKDKEWSRHPLYKDDPNKIKDADEKTAAFMKEFVKECENAQLFEDPAALCFVLTACDSQPELVTYLSAKIKTFGIDDQDFYEISVVLVNVSTDKTIGPAIKSILVKSKDNPFKNLPKFLEILDRIASYSQISSDLEVLRIVLKRGKQFTDEDAQTKEKVQKTLDKYGIKL